MANLMVGDRDVRKISIPAKNSHKGQNGILTIIGGSTKYHGAPLLAIKAASRFVDLLYFHSPEKSNMELLHFLKGHKCTFIGIDAKELDKTIQKSDCVLIGNGMEINPANKKLLNSLLKKYSKKKKFVLDAGALHMVDKKLLNSNVIITPHILEFYALFGKNANKASAPGMAKKYGCIVLLKHPDGDLISDGKSLFINQTGNEGMTKGGTGDTLAGLCAALACKNSLFLAAKCAAYLNGLAGDLLKKERGVHFDADDLADYFGVAFEMALEKK
ncbi:MAG: NAD(P)H-hydrate dehydratase [Candidatus Micrarchaeota archaeon]